MRFQMERPASWQVCLVCSKEITELDPHPRCPSCGGLLEVQHLPPRLSRSDLIERFTERRGQGPGAPASGVWRFREIVLPSATEVVSHPEGNTPLLHRPALDRWTGAQHLLLKHEGYNPTGSFKDRGMTVGVTQARRIGATAVACASTGNTSASLAAYAAQAGIPALVLVPAEQVAIGKLAQSLAYGARTLLVRGDFDDCLRLVEEASQRLGVYLLNSINPFRIEGQKTIVLEMLQQLGWEPPDWIVLPAGNLGNTAAFGKALLEAHRWGLISRVPRLAAVQAAGAAPFARSFAEDFETRYSVRAETVATAIRIGDPASFVRAVHAIRETEGLVLAVSDAEILEAKAAVDGCGIGCEPASAASVAGVRELVRRGLMAPEEHAVAVLTGHILKDPGLLLKYHREMDPPPPGANRPIEIEPELGAIERVLASR
jgi:threonine synthase